MRTLADLILLRLIQRVFPGSELIQPEECGCELCQSYIKQKKGKAA